MVIKRWVVWVPLGLTVLMLGGIALLPIKAPVGRGMMLGVIVAYGQSLLSVAAMKWAWQKSFFYWVWGGGILFRFVVFAVTAYVVWAHTPLSLVATLLALVTTTTVFLVFESSVTFNKG